MVKRRDVLAAGITAGAGALGGGAILANTLKNQGERTRAQAGDMADRAANKSDRLNRNLEELDSSQQGFDSAEQYVSETRSQLESIDQSLEQVVENGLEQTSGLSGEDRVVEPGTHLGKNDEYFVNAFVNSGSVAGGQDVRDQHGDDHAQITDRGAPLPGIDSRMNLAIQDGATPEKGDLVGWAKTYKRLAGEYQSAASTLKEEAQYAEDRQQELNNEEEEAHQEEVAKLKTDLQKTAQQYRNNAQRMRGTAQFMRTIAGASGKNLNITWGETVNREAGKPDAEYRESPGDDCSITEEEIAAETGYSDGDLFYQVEGDDLEVFARREDGSFENLGEYGDQC